MASGIKYLCGVCEKPFVTVSSRNKHERTNRICSEANRGKEKALMGPLGSPLFEAHRGLTHPNRKSVCDSPPDIYTLAAVKRMYKASGVDMEAVQSMVAKS